MSSGSFIVGIYESSVLGLRMKILTQIETRGFQVSGEGANTIPGGGVQLGLFANVNMATSGLGVRPRMLIVRFAPGVAPPPGYSVGTRYRIPILRAALWDSAAPGVSAGLYLNREVLIVGKLPEIAR